MKGREELSRVKAVLFDLDGTLLDSLPGIRYSAEAAFAQCGLAMRDVELRRLIGPPIRPVLPEGTDTGPEAAPDTVFTLIAPCSDQRADHATTTWLKSSRIRSSVNALAGSQAHAPSVIHAPADRTVPAACRLKH